MGLTAGDVARVLGVDLKTVHRWVELGYLSARRTEGRHLRFMRPELVRMMRWFEYRIPPALVRPRARVLSCGVVGSPAASLSRSFDVRTCSDLYDAAFMMAGGDCEVLLVDLDAFPVSHVLRLVRALRRHSLTTGMASIGLAGKPHALRQFVAGGGDVAMQPHGDIAAAVRWLVGARAQPGGLLVKVPDTTVQPRAGRNGARRPRLSTR